LGNDRIPLWLLKTPSLKIVDFLVWHKKNYLGLGNWLRSNAEYCFLIQKFPQTGKVFKNRSFGNIWEENVLPPSKRQHPHQKPRELIKALIMATTEQGDLIVLEVCQEFKRNFVGCDLTFREMEKFRQKKANSEL
jgi:site-specific DNA-methyltransferase (adenine-specific)